MEKVKRTSKHRVRKHWVRNLSLKWSFMLYVTIGVIVAIIAMVSVGSHFSGLASDLYHQYVDFDDSGRAIIRIESPDGVSNEDNWRSRYNLYQSISEMSILVISFLGVFMTGIAFYNRKLKQPLQLINAASAKIADGNLDFEVSYDNRNEMGRLVTSIDTMRAALGNNYKEMWRKIEQRKCLNAAFAHDLRTPLTVLKGYTEYLKTYIPEGKVSEEKNLSTIELMHAYILRLEGYTTSMSMVQKLEETEINPQATELEALCKRLKSAAGMLCSPYALTFECDCTGTIEIDSDIVSQVLENLVSNASRYAAKCIRVHIRLIEGKILQLIVADDGGGFPDHMIRDGIKPYNRAKDKDILSEHYGLGLYICKVLCKCHGGDLVIENDGGAKGTATFACQEKH